MPRLRTIARPTSLLLLLPLGAASLLAPGCDNDTSRDGGDPDSAVSDGGPATAPGGPRVAATTSSSSLRQQLTSVPPAPALAQAVAAFKANDPNATFTWLRGHVDSFATKPRATIPPYARPILEAAGLPTQAQAVPTFTTTTTPNVGAGLEDVSKALPYSREAAAPPGGGGSTQDADGAPPPAGLPHEARSPTAAPIDGRAPQPGEAEAAKAILKAFLSQNDAVFKLGPALLDANLPNLKLVRYGVGKFGRRLVFQPSVGQTPLLDGKTIVMLDLNWNVISISRQIATPAKLPLAAATLSEASARQRAVQTLADRYHYPTAQWKVLEATRGADAIRGKIAWQVRAAVSGVADVDRTVTLDGASGAVLNISDNVDRHTDAQLLRWGYTGGDLTEPNQYQASNFYTRDDDSLEHDFFYLANDDRSNGALGACSETSVASLTAAAAYGTTSSATYVRPTLRGDRDFTLWQPSAPKGSFGEGQAYYWSRFFMQWLKGSFADLGVLPASVADYPRALVVVNACYTNGAAGVHFSSYSVTTLDNKGEGTNTILLPEHCRSGNPECPAGSYDDADTSHTKSVESGGGYASPGVIQHELNHYVMKAFYDIQSPLDCNTDNELKYLHEGAFGRFIPQMYWHHYYNVGFDADEDKLYRGNEVSGERHADDATRHELAAFPCGSSDPDDPDYMSPYEAGSVVAQPLWEIYHGKQVNGAAVTSTGRPANDTDMLETTYLAADLVSGSSFKDRWEMANRFMEVWDTWGVAAPATKTDWCETWAHHGLDTFIINNYCN